jgi:hypothetical protein
MQDVEAFYKFLDDFPDDGLCATGDGHFALPGEAGYTPFRKRPAKSSQSDIHRFVHALLKAWHSMGYIRIVVDAGSCQPSWPRECRHDDDLYRPGCP